MRPRITFATAVLLAGTCGFASGQIPRGGGQTAQQSSQFRERYGVSGKNPNAEAIERTKAATRQQIVLQQQAQANARAAQATQKLAQTNTALLVTNYVTADESFRRVDGKLYNRSKSVLWKQQSGTCVRVTTNGVVVQQYSNEWSDPVRAPVNYKRDVFGNAAGPRSIVVSETETKVPTKKILIRNLPLQAFVGATISAYAMQVGSVDVQGESLECWDCGTVNIVPVVSVRTNR